MTENNKYLCYFCNKSTITGCALNNENKQTFIYMPIHTRSHAECYIDHVVKISFEKHLKEKQ